METGVNIIILPAAPGPPGGMGRASVQGTGTRPKKPSRFWGIRSTLQGWGHPGGLGTRQGFTGENLFFLMQSKSRSITALTPTGVQDARRGRGDKGRPLLSPHCSSRLSRGWRPCSRGAFCPLRPTSAPPNTNCTSGAGDLWKGPLKSGAGGLEEKGRCRPRCPHWRLFLQREMCTSAHIQPGSASSPSFPPWVVLPMAGRPGAP